ncbi:exosortase-associated protein EpsI, B-type [Massilia sp. GCM10020059]|uniref:EpsI family protein n=1 Tax=Massilia agrisoli TaxID=2892444 RepID=A0ABS8IY74_9BURK|nr:exosortase-associated protein EpsI, B-type [Massilia agrisoli]MCC6072643.1 EpsI family protein [Massilia agrisoli]
MNRRILASVVLGAAMVSASALTGALTPTVKLAEQQGQFKLETMIPASFGQWQVDTSIVPLQADPEQQELLEKIYDQTLSRTYVDRDGQRVMLSIAYGGDQSRALQIHLPEVCYVAQGFDMLDSRDDMLDTGHGVVPVKRLVAKQNARNEPITYWITVGDKAIKSGIEQKIQRFAYGLSGKIPDGMLVRVSTIGPNAASAYQVQDRFIKDMLSVVDGRDRVRLMGAATAERTAAR